MTFPSLFSIFITYKRTITISINKKKMAGKTTTTTTKKGSASTEYVLGQAAQHITKAVSELNTAVETVRTLTSQSEDLTLQVASKEAQIAELDVQYAEKARQAEVEFELNMKANAERVVLGYLNTNGKVAVTNAEWNSLQKEFGDYKANAEAEAKKAVAVATNALKTQYENDIKLLNSENKAIAAENASKIGVLAEKNKFLEDQVTKLYSQLDAERSASIERARASSVGSINVTGAGK